MLRILGVRFLITGEKSMNMKSGKASTNLAEWDWTWRDQGVFFNIHKDVCGWV